MCSEKSVVLLLQQDCLQLLDRAFDPLPCRSNLWCKEKGRAFDPLLSWSDLQSVVRAGW